MAALALAAPPSVGAQQPWGWRLMGADREAYELSIDREIIHGGEASKRIRSRGAVHLLAWTATVQVVDAAAYRGERLRMSGYARSEGAASASLWLRIEGRIDGRITTLGFDSMYDRPISGTTGWTYYEVVLEVPDGAGVLLFGALLEGEGTLWVDDMSLEVVEDDVKLTAEPISVVEGKDHNWPSLIRATPWNLDFEQSDGGN